MKQLKFLLITFIFISFALYLMTPIIRYNHSYKVTTVILKSSGDKPYFFHQSRPSKQAVMDALSYYCISNKSTVYSQIILETGNFTSSLSKVNNNLFGLYNSNTKKFFKFNHWTESVKFYKERVQNRHRINEDYFKFLVRIGYAEDSLYIQKLKQLIND